MQSNLPIKLDLFYEWGSSKFWIARILFRYTFILFLLTRNPNSFPDVAFEDAFGKVKLKLKLSQSFKKLFRVLDIVSSSSKIAIR